MPGAVSQPVAAARAAFNFDLSGTTRTDNHVLKHSLMIPGPVATCVAVVTGLAMAGVIL
ncbi:MAG: hypothetical protein JNK55_09670 [Rubrivivax sp.]|nr:hypothetical protein [Rubrivivax sp.]